MQNRPITATPSWKTAPPRTDQDDHQSLPKPTQVKSDDGRKISSHPASDPPQLTRKRLAPIDSRPSEILASRQQPKAVGPALQSYHRDQWNNAALSLLLKLSSFEYNKNHIVSPHSIFETLTLLAAGAAGHTQRLTLNLMGATPETFEPFKQLVQSGSGQVGAMLSHYNAILVASRKTLKADYQEFVSRFDPAVDIREKINFADREQVEQLVSSINGRVGELTEGMITNCLDENSLKPRTALALVNACYFKGAWNVHFDSKPGTFHTPDQGDVTVPMLVASEPGDAIAYSRHQGWVAVAIPYQERAEMVIMLPPQGALPTTITANIFQSLQRRLRYRELRLSMPEYLFESKYALEEHLRTQPDDMFSDSADFSNMVHKGPLWVDSIKHKAKIQTDKKGTRAAAVTVTEMVDGPSAELNVAIDHPFLFFIRDREQHGLIRFIGQLWNPATGHEPDSVTRDWDYSPTGSLHSLDSVTSERDSSATGSLRSPVQQPNQEQLGQNLCRLL